MYVDHVYVFFEVKLSDIKYITSFKLCDLIECWYFKLNFKLASFILETYTSI